MKKSISILLCMVLLFGIVSQAFANEILQAEEVSTEKAVKPIAYTHDFDGYSNVVGVLNSDGTKTAYLFASAQQAEQVEATVGLEMPAEFKLQQNSAAQSRGAVSPAIMDAPVYSDVDTTNYGSASQMVIGEVLPYFFGRAYMKFDLSFLIAEEIPHYDVLSACLYFTEVENQEIDRGAPNVIQAYLVDGQWSESTITWENKPDYYGYEMIGCSNVGTKEYINGENSDAELIAIEPINKLYITKAVMAWLQGLPNNGILLKEKDDQYESCFYTSEDRDNAPYVTVTYSFSNTSLGQGIVNNQLYYIVNKETGKYLTSLTGVTNSPITQEEFSTNYATTQQWKFIKHSATTGYYIALGSNNFRVRSTNSGNGTNVLLGNQTSSTYQLWKPIRNWNGTYHFQTNASSGFSMKAGGETAVVQSPYGCDFNHYDEWTLIPVNKGTASFFDFDIDIDTTYGTSVMHEYAQNLGYGVDAVNINGTTNLTAAQGFSALQRSGLFYFSGHGLPGKLNFFTGTDVSSGNLVSSDALVETSLDRSLDDLNNSGLSQLQLAVLSTCLTGRDPIDETNGSIGVNMTGRLYQLGAHNVVSYFNETIPGYDLGWNSAFMTNVLLGRSLKTAKFRADNHLYDDYFREVVQGDDEYPHGNLNERHDLGDENLVPGFTISNALAKNNYDYMELPSTIDKNLLINVSLPLPRDAINERGGCVGNEFDVYMDAKGGVYWYYKTTNVLHSYEPYTDNLKLGNTTVNGAEAIRIARSFLGEIGYSTSAYHIKTSNAYSKNYKVEFEHNEERKKLVFHMQADENGAVFINNFAAYVTNYDYVGG